MSRAGDSHSSSEADTQASVVGRAQQIRAAKGQFFDYCFTALDFNQISGDYVEFGSYGGMTASLAWDQIQGSNVARHIWAFDSFAGLPETDDPRDQHPRWRAHTMAMGIDGFHAALTRSGVPREAYSTVEGFFEDSLPPLGRDGPPTDIALAYIDCDLHSSTATVLRFLEPRLKHGMVLAFDDYYCWSATSVSGERAAFGEFAAKHPEWSFHRYRDIFWGGTSFVVEHRDLDAADRASTRLTARLRRRLRARR